MSQAQDVILSLLGNAPLWELTSDEHQQTFENIKTRLETTTDLNTELQTLYKVQGFSDFALSLMWIAQKAENNPLMFSTSPEDESLVFSKFRLAVGESEAAAESFLQPTEPIEMTEAMEVPAPPAEEQTPSLVTEESPSTFEAMPAEPAMAEAPSSTGTGDEKSFAALVEKLVEAMQSGDDTRTTLLDQVIAECGAVTAGQFPDDYKEFCQYLTEFLTYISDNQYLDDVRVMNILSNVSSPVSQWANTPPDARVGLLEDGIAPLREFKFLFE